jgi:hypothetical protein
LANIKNYTLEKYEIYHSFDWFLIA